VIQITGTDLSGLDNESGGHRIQRIPPTERRGRVHTSTVTVAVIDPDLPQIEISPTDLRVEWYSGTGAGGQHRNKHQNSCRITHIATGITATAQCRSRENSLTQARDAIIQRVNDQIKNLAIGAQAQHRREQVGSGMRGDKIRTYRFQDDVVQDHNTGRRAQVSAVMRGQFDRLW
jgi:peptide chain release factor 1